MTQEEKDKLNQKRMDRLKDDNKGRIKAAIIIPVIAIVVSVIIFAVGKSKDSDIQSATVLNGMSVSSFVSGSPDGFAIYTGKASAVEPERLYDSDKGYIMVKREVTEVEKVYDKEKDKYDNVEKTLNTESLHCREIALDDVTVPYDVFHTLPSKHEVENEGNRKYTYDYIPESVEGTYFIKCKGGKITSVEYYSGENVALQNSSVFVAILVIIWVIVIVAEVLLIKKILAIKKVVDDSSKSDE